MIEYCTDDNKSHHSIEGQCYQFTSCGGRIVRELILSLSNTLHEEADTLVAFHHRYVLNISPNASVSTRTNDTDILVQMVTVLNGLPDGGNTV